MLSYLSHYLFLSSAFLRDLKIVSLFWWTIPLVPQLWTSYMHSFPKEFRAVRVGIFISWLQWILVHREHSLTYWYVWHVPPFNWVGTGWLMGWDRTQNDQGDVLARSTPPQPLHMENPGPEKRFLRKHHPIISWALRGSRQSTRPCSPGVLSTGRYHECVHLKCELGDLDFYDLCLTFYFMWLQMELWGLSPAFLFI